MRNLLKVVMIFVILSLLSACGSSKTETGESNDKEVNYIVYPKDALEIIPDINNITPPPDSVFDTPASENGLEGVIYKFTGEVTSVEKANEENGNSDAVIVNTDQGDIYIADFYSVFINEMPEAANDEIREKVKLPNQGEFVCIYGEYTGYSETLKIPVAFFCSHEIITEMLISSVENAELNNSSNQQFEEKQTINAQIGTSLFEDIYVPYASRKKDFSFNSIKNFSKECGYEYTVTEPTEEDFGEVKIIDGDNYVYFAFLPNSDGIDSAYIVNYYQAETKTEVSFEIFSTDFSPEYDHLTTHILGNSKEDVKSIDEQRNFLFPIDSD